MMVFYRARISCNSKLFAAPIIASLLLLIGCEPSTKVAQPTILPTARIALATVTITATPSPSSTASLTPSLIASPTSSSTASPSATSSPTTIPTETSTVTPLPGEALDATAVEAEIVVLINQLRSENGLPPLIYNADLSIVARAHSCDLAAHDMIAHTSSDGRTLVQRMPTADPPWEWPSENIAAGYGGPQAVVTAWFDEIPPDDWHRRNILDPDQREIGVGYCYDPETSTGNKHYYTADFARRASTATP